MVDTQVLPTSDSFPLVASRDSRRTFFGVYCAYAYCCLIVSARVSFLCWRDAVRPTLFDPPPLIGSPSSLFLLSATTESTPVRPTSVLSGPDIPTFRNTRFQRRLQEEREQEDMSSSSDEDADFELSGRKKAHCYKIESSMDGLQWAEELEDYLNAKRPETGKATALVWKKAQVCTFIEGRRKVEIKEWMTLENEDLVPTQDAQGNRSADTSWKKASLRQCLQGVAIHFAAQEDEEEAEEDLRQWEITRGMGILDVNERFSSLVRKCKGSISADDLQVRKMYITLFEADKDAGISINLELRKVVKKANEGDTLERLFKLAVSIDKANDRDDRIGGG